MAGLLKSFSQDCNSLRYQDTITGDFLVYQNIHYATADPYGILPSQDLLLDFYEPFGDTLSRRPLIIFSFGGAFLIGDKSQPFIPDFCQYFAKRGFATAAINYRIGFNTLDQGSAERAAYRAVQDIRAALRFLAENTAVFRIDTNNIFLAGTSAGCVASLHSVFMTESDRPASTYGTLLEPADLGCANCSGNNYYGNHDVKVRGIINCWGAILDTLYIDPGKKDSIPVISFHGTNDLIVPYVYGNPFQLPIFPPMYGSYTIHQRLNHLGISNKLRTFSGAGHEPELLNNWSYADTIFEETKDFLFEIIKPVTSAITGADTSEVGNIENYSVNYTNGSRYCWEVTGGNVISQSSNAIQVIWQDPGAQHISVNEVNKINAAGASVSITVYVNETFTASQIIDKSEKGITIFPNPAENKLFLSTKENIYRLGIFDISGKKVFSEDVLKENSLYEFNVSFLLPGIYQLRIYMKDSLINRKVVKI